MNQIIQTMIQQVLIALANSTLTASQIVFDEKHNSIHFTIKTTSSYIYKIVMRYDIGQDLYHLTFMKMYIGKNMGREDWYSPRLTDWTTDVYFDMLTDIIECLYRNRNEHTYYQVEDIL